MSDRASPDPHTFGDLLKLRVVESESGNGHHGVLIHNPEERPPTEGIGVREAGLIMDSSIRRRRKRDPCLLALSDEIGSERTLLGERPDPNTVTCRQVRREGRGEPSC